MIAHSQPTHKSREETEYGPVNIGFQHWAIYWQGKIVDYAHGDAKEAERRYAKQRKARLEDATIDEWQDVPTDQLPDSYWKNGDCPRLDTWWNVESAGQNYSVSRDGKVAYND